MDFFITVPAIAKGQDPDCDEHSADDPGQLAGSGSLQQITQRKPAPAMAKPVRTQVAKVRSAAR